MISGLSAFFNRHKKKILITTGILTTGYFTVEYLKNKLIEMQDTYLKNKLVKDNLQKRFNQNQIDSNFTVISLLPNLINDVFEHFPVEKITRELQRKRTEKVTFNADDKSDITNVTGMTPNPDQAGNTPESSIVNISTSVINEPSTKTKTELWNDLKITTINRLFALIYSTSLLVFFTKLQLNLLGKNSYIDSIKEFDNLENYIEAENEDNNVSNRLYLNLCWYFLNKGWLNLSDIINESVSEVFASVNPRSDLSLSELSDLIGKVQFLIDSKFDSSFSSILLPANENELVEILTGTFAEPSSITKEDIMTPQFQSLYYETLDFIESPNSHDLVKRLVHDFLSNVFNQLSLSFQQSSQGSLKLASILVNLTKQANGLQTVSEDNLYLNSLLNLSDLNTFAALVYSNYNWKSM